MAVCPICGKDFKPRRPNQKYDRPACRKKASYHHKTRPRRGLRAAKAVAAKQVAQEQPKRLTSGEFGLMMTESTDEALVTTARILRKALEDPDTSSSALAQLSKEYLEVIDRIDERRKQQAGPASTVEDLGVETTESFDVSEV